MLRICHLRGPKNYWLKRLKHQYSVITEWQKIKQFNLLDYRKKIRNIVISSIKKSNDYDVICFNDEELKKLLSKLSTNETILYHSQDDDDIYVGRNITNRLNDGIYHTPYVIFDKFLVDKLHKNNEYNIDINQLYRRRANKTGSCNLIIQSKYFYIETILNSIAKNSFYTRNRIRNFFKETSLEQTQLTDIINIELKSFFSLTFLKRIQNTYSENEDLNELMTRTFMEEFNNIHSINIKNVNEWGELKNIYKEFAEIILKCTI